jgi:Xaa-Pro aminopeptidase
MRKLLVLIVLLVQFSAALDRQPNADYQARRHALAAKTKGGIVLMFAPMESETTNNLFPFRQDNNFFYLTGWPEPGAGLLIQAPAAATDKSPAIAYTEILFLPARNYPQEKWTGPKLGPENPDAAKITGFDQVKSLDSLRDEIVRLSEHQGGPIYADLPTPHESTNASSPGLQWLVRANAFGHGGPSADVKPLIESLRTAKDAGEIERLRKASQASVAAHIAAMRAVKPGVNESYISSLMQFEWGKRGCDRPAYSPIVGSGLNSTVLHYGQDSETMQAGDVVVIDAAGEYSMYAMDITRTLPISGKFTPRQREIYDIVLGAQQAAVAAFVSGKSKIRPGQPDSLHNVAYDYINTHGKDLHGEPLGKYFIHGLGHYVGMQVHDANDYDQPLGPGSVFTMEPGIYIPEEKIGIRIEDTFYVDANGKLINFDEGLPSKAEDVEKMMAGK